MTTSELGILGAGHMGAAIIKGVVSSRGLEAARVLVVDRAADRRSEAAGLGCRVAADPAALREVETIVVCVRPQDFHDASQALQGSQERLVISVMAGLTGDVVGEALGPGTRVVRAMPNAPAVIGRGMTAVAACHGATPADVSVARGIFDHVGQSIEVEEPSMWAVTAVSGSGPAWFYLVAEAIAEEGGALGLSESVVQTLVRGTLDGAAAMMLHDRRALGDVVDSVTTPGGTTEAGLAAMNAAGLKEAVRAGVRAARDRGETLAREGQ